MKAVELAKFIIASYPDKSITPMKLQKLAYYAKVWTLVAKQPFLNASFEKWAYGPVNQSVYFAYKKHGASIIPHEEYEANINDEQKELLQFILDNYVDYSAFTLSAMTHNEDPWKETTANAIIHNSAIIAYYAKQPFAKNFPQDQTGKPFHVLQSNNWHSFTLDMDKEEAETFATYPSSEEFHQHGNKASNDFKELLQDINALL